MPGRDEHEVAVDEEARRQSGRNVRMGRLFASLGLLLAGRVGWSDLSIVGGPLVVGIEFTLLFLAYKVLRGDNEGAEGLYEISKTQTPWSLFFCLIRYFTESEWLVVPAAIAVATYAYLDDVDRPDQSNTRIGPYTIGPYSTAALLTAAGRFSGGGALSANPLEGVTHGGMAAIFAQIQHSSDHREEFYTDLMVYAGSSISSSLMFMLINKLTESWPLGVIAAAIIDLGIARLVGDNAQPARAPGASPS